jgi:hypothetical protein
MILIPDVPSFHEWVMLIQQDAEQAKQILIALKARNKKQGLLADASLEISIEEFEDAQRLFTKATTDPAQAARVARIAQIGRAVLGPYPNSDDWAALINDDPDFAESVYNALRTKAAMFGLQTSQAVLMSIAAYEAVTSNKD